MLVFVWVGVGGGGGEKSLSRDWGGGGNRSLTGLIIDQCLLTKCQMPFCPLLSVEITFPKGTSLTHHHTRKEEGNNRLSGCLLATKERGTGKRGPAE